MNAAVLDALGRPPRFGQFPEPAPGDGEALVHVRAAALKPVDKQMASGSHYGSPRELPVICGTDGVGCLDDGSRVFFGGARQPYGAMAQWTVVPRALCWPIPEGVDDITAAALVNPGVSAWLSLAWRAQLAAGETVLILGATGATGKLAVQIAKLLGAGRVIAAGRHAQTLAMLRGIGADAVISLDRPTPELTEAFAGEARNGAFHVVIDYLWGRPTEALLAALTSKDMKLAASRVRLVEVGESAGPTISLPAAVLRSSGLEIVGAGTGATPPFDMIRDAYQKLMARAASGELRVDAQPVPLADIEEAWQRESRTRQVIVP